MPLHFAEATAVLSGVVAVEDAEPLASWLRQTPDPLVDLADCHHLHTAALQALLAARVSVGDAPADPFLRSWVLPLLAVRDLQDGSPGPATDLPPSTEHPAPEEVSA